jgi:uncharacterized protein (DUF924 family)
LRICHFSLLLSNREKFFLFRNHLEKLQMQQLSVFVAECLCGRTFETATREYVCPHCHRQIILEWGRDPDRDPPDKGNQDMNGEAAA